MRGKQPVQASALAVVDPDDRIPRDRPLRTIRTFAHQALAQLSAEFDRLYAQTCRLSIPTARLIKASLLISLFSVRSERALCEELEYDPA